MGILKKWINQPTVIINGVEYIQKELTKEYLLSELEDEIKDCFNNDERDGIELAMKRISNALKNER